MKVFAITHHEYSTVIAIFSTLERASDYLHAVAGRAARYFIDEFDVDEPFEVAE